MSESSVDARVHLAQERTNLAYERNRWASERTLMAWIRTSISLVTAGFAVDRFVAYLSHQHDDLSLGLGDHWYGLALVIVGVLLLSLAVVEHVTILRRLNARQGARQSVLSLPLLGACVILLIGAVALLILVQSSVLYGQSSAP